MNAKDLKHLKVGDTVRYKKSDKTAIVQDIGHPFGPKTAWISICLADSEHLRGLKLCVPHTCLVIQPYSSGELT